MRADTRSWVNVSSVETGLDRNLLPKKSVLGVANLAQSAMKLGTRFNGTCCRIQWNLVQYIHTCSPTHTYMQADAYVRVTRCLRTCTSACSVHQAVVFCVQGYHVSHTSQVCSLHDSPIKLVFFLLPPSSFHLMQYAQTISWLKLKSLPSLSFQPHGCTLSLKGVEKG